MSEEDYLAHYGVLRRSGRYPWGSGGPEFASNKGFISYANELHKKGLSEPDIARAMGIGTTDRNGNFRPSTTQLRAAKTIAKNEEKQSNITQAVLLREKGTSTTEIGRRLGIPEPTVRNLLQDSTKAKADILMTTANMLKEKVGDNNLIDVGAGSNLHIGVSEGMLNNAVAVLKEKGYEAHTVKIEQLGTGKFTNTKVLAPPGTSWGDVNKRQSDIQPITAFSKDNGRTFLGLQPPLSIDLSRVAIKYGKDGGSKSDGAIFVRPGVKDVSIGENSYAQVRVMVNNTHYLKGVAMYKQDLPKGVDIEFHTNKEDTGNKLDAMKPLKVKASDGKIDQDNPFGANIKLGGQIIEKDHKGKDRVTSAMNIVNEEGDWHKWSKTLSSQMLSKQTPTLIKTQLDLTHKNYQKEFEELASLTNPAVRKKLLEGFGDNVSKAAVDLKAAAIPRTHGHHVILPISTMKPNEIYAPNYRDGERVVLIRHPHGGTFEIPELTVNNRHREAKTLIGKGAIDAVGIHHSVAERLSGADFDGDTVLVIPNNNRRIKTTPALEGLKGFDARAAYPAYEGMVRMTEKSKGRHMGDITNLINDMTLKNASNSEMAAAIRHSMVVIDAVNHNLNYKESARRNGIAHLKEKYQGSARGGASTLISLAKSQYRIPNQVERKASLGGPIDKKTGKRVYVPTGEGRTDKNGVFRPYEMVVPRLSVTDNAHDLSSGTVREHLYAEHSNRLKAMGDAARKLSVNTPRSRSSQSAAIAYAAEVKTLTANLNLAKRNAPRERQAQIVAMANYKQKLKEYPDMDDETKKKIRFQALNDARNKMDAQKHAIIITPKEWEAIQAGAISDSKLNDILEHADLDVVRKLATPRPSGKVTASKMNQAKGMLANGFTRAEIADRLGVSLNALAQALKEAT